MANIKPFRGYRYNAEKVDELNLVISPPYYNIAPEEKEELYNLSEYNSVRLFSGRDIDGKTEDNNRFTRAAKYLKDWIAEGVLVRDEKPTIYMLEQTIEYHGIQYQNKSFVALVELEDFDKGVISSCEEIREVSRQDRYDFLTHTNADMSMISCLYLEREKDLSNIMVALSEKNPDMDLTSHDKIQHRLWKITDTDTIDYIVGHFKNLQLYITDGQTRYETCLKYRDYMKSKNPNHTGKEPYNFTMVSLSNASSDGLAILPVHRQVKLPRKFREDYFVSGIQDNFKIEKIIVDTQDEGIIPTMKKQIATQRMETKIAVYHSGEYFFRITLKNRDYIKKELLPDKSDAYCSLDMVVLNQLVIKDVLHVKDEDYDDCVQSSRSSRKCMEDIRDDKADVMFVMNPVKTEQIKNVAAAGEKLPMRTLSVFPKPSVGVLINVKED